jgi:exodeoxyribonuclease V alpha subunit
MAPVKAPLEVVHGTLERITFQNPETHFTVGRLRIDGRRDLVAIVGTLVAVEVGEALRCEGRWETWKRDGREEPQFRVEAYTAITPETAIGIERYLGSGLVHGVGPALAKRIVEHFGDRTLAVLADEPWKLRQVEGIGEKRQHLLVSAWREHRAVRDIMVFLQGHGIGPAHAARIHKTYGDDAIARVSENPYKLADDVWGIGFLTADKIAQKMGVPHDSAKRAGAGVRYVLSKAAEDGHVCIPRKDLVEEATRALGLAKEAIDRAIDAEIEANGIVQEKHPAAAIDAEPWCYGRGLHTAEVALAEGLRALRDAPRGLPPIKTDKAIEWVEARRGIQLGASQRAALRAVLEAKVSVITGGPGVGKTTIVASLVDIVEAKHAKVRLAAPTGRAAKRLEETTGREAKTIHRLLKWNPRTSAFEHDAENPLPQCDVLILDEASMIDLPLMARVVAALPLSTHLVVVGDRDQLPSVGPGNILSDLVASKAVAVARLTEIFRQAAASRIVTEAHRVNSGETPDLAPLDGPGDFHFVRAETPEKALEYTAKLVTEALPRRFGYDPVRDIQVLAPMHRGGAGVKALNEQLQRALGKGGPRAERYGRSFGAGDKVLQLRNDYDKDVYNGDVGVVDSVDDQAHKVLVRFDGGERVVEYGYPELDELDLGYCVSIHKSQGSEYPCVVIPILTQHFVMLQRNLLYTAITRGKRRVVLVGQPRAVSIAARNADVRGRGSFLAERLRTR